MPSLKEFYIRHVSAQPPVVRWYMLGAIAVVAIAFTCNLFYYRILGDDVETWRPNNRGGPRVYGRSGHFYHK